MDSVGEGAEFTQKSSPKFGAIRSNFADLDGGMSVMTKIVPLVISLHVSGN